MCVTNENYLIQAGRKKKISCNNATPNFGGTCCLGLLLNWRQR